MSRTETTGGQALAGFTGSTVVIVTNDRLAVIKGVGPIIRRKAP